MAETKKFNGLTYTYRVGIKRKDTATAYVKMMQKQGYLARKTYVLGRGWIIWVRK